MYVIYDKLYYNTDLARWAPVSSCMMRVSLDGRLTVGEPSVLVPPTAGARDSRSTRITSCCSWEVFQVSCVACREVMARHNTLHLSLHIINFTFLKVRTVTHHYDQDQMPFLSFSFWYTQHITHNSPCNSFHSSGLRCC